MWFFLMSSSLLSPLNLQSLKVLTLFLLGVGSGIAQNFMATNDKQIMQAGN